jgi:hypothetical protein
LNGQNGNPDALFTDHALLPNATELCGDSECARQKTMSTATTVRNQTPPDAAADSGDPTALLARPADLSRRLQEREEFYRSMLESLGAP